MSNEQEQERRMCLALSCLLSCPIISVHYLIFYSFVTCSAAATADGLIASASEDNTARLWRTDGSCLQVCVHLHPHLQG